MRYGRRLSTQVLESATDEVARRLLSRLLVDLQRCGGPVVVEDGRAAVGKALYSGEWGAALAYAELSRADQSSRWQLAAEALATADSRASGRGVFTGPEGRQIALMAIGRGGTRLARRALDASGDLMDGALGQIWKEICLGSRIEHPTLEPVATNGGLGLAHGELGALVPSLRAISSDQLTDVGRRLRLPGWCNGSAGLAAVALVAYRWTSDEAFLLIARTATRASLADSADLETDGLCHGTMGVLAVAAGIARASEDTTLELEVRSRADDVCARAAASGWRLDSGKLADQSWLTGIAGMAWGLTVLKRQPVVNPLSPADAAVGR